MTANNIIKVEQKKDGEIKIKRYYRSCRNCSNFIRVREKKGDVPVRGFCRLGENINEFGLYISGSFSEECNNFELDEKKAYQTKREDDFRDRRSKFADQYARQLKRAIKKGKPAKSKFNFMHWLISDIEFTSEAIRRFNLDHFDSL